VFRAKIADLDAEGLQLLRFDSDGLIEDIIVMLRPIRAAMALAQTMGPILERQPDGSYALRTPRPVTGSAAVAGALHRDARTRRCTDE